MSAFANILLGGVVHAAVLFLVAAGLLLALASPAFAGRNGYEGQPGHQSEQADIDERVTDANACQQSEGSCLPWKQWNQCDGSLFTVNGRPAYHRTLTISGRRRARVWAE